MKIFREYLYSPKNTNMLAYVASFKIIWHNSTST